MVLTAAPAPAPYAAAYLIHPDALDSVRALLQASGMRITKGAEGSGQVPRFLISSDRYIPARDASLANLLNERELQVLEGMAQGLTNIKIGEGLYLSEETIKSHARTMFRKLGANDRAHAVAIGFRSGILGGVA